MNYPRSSAFICGSLLLTFVLSCFARADEVQTYDVPEHHLSISHPSTWKKVSGSPPGAVFAVEVDSPQMPNGKGPGMVVLTVMPAQQLQGIDSLAALSEKWMTSLGKNFKGLKSVTSEDASVDGQPAKAMTLIGSRGGSNFVFFEMLVLRDGKGFILQMMAVDLYSDEMKSQFDKVVASWKWTDKSPDQPGETRPGEPSTKPTTKPPTTAPSDVPSTAPSGSVFGENRVPFLDSRHGIELTYPPVFEPTKEKKPNIFLILRRKTTAATPVPTEMIFGAIAQRKDPARPPDLEALSKRQFDIARRTLTATQELDAGETTLDSVPAKFLVIRGKAKDRLERTIMTVVAVKDSSLYIVTAMSSPEAFENLRKDMDSTLETIRWTKEKR